MGFWYIFEPLNVNLIKDFLVYPMEMILVSFY